MVPLYNNESAKGKESVYAPVKEMKLRDYIQILKTEPTDLRIFFYNILDSMPELLKDFKYPDIGLKFFKRLPALFFGGGNSKVFTHYDIDLPDSMHFHFHGNKSVTLFSQEQTKYLYKVPFAIHNIDKIDMDNPDFETMKDLVTEHKNIIVCRTASKIHGFAGVRIGFAFAHPDTLKLIAGPFNLSLANVAVAGAVESYQDLEYQTFVKQKNRESMDILEKMFEELGLRYIKSNTNFAFFNAGRPSTEVANELRKHGILSGRPFPPFLNWVRMSTVKPEEMQYVADTYRKLFG